ncbi:hypothetical protein PAXRUDRAFT_828337 [Paxillus rubicundulus Ve08.2h10]|uniref:Uncharacterized protein n=1 Tax=Paxillus rubicundulus Ve08.2h10 TaxID=930991 RepID=A0A0D0DWA7_9AGAM|nr:hypothetical protein PAXRUDRAFT_828337 [Paxillus rubicundulus Ve08.2h10]
MPCSWRSRTTPGASGLKGSVTEKMTMTGIPSLTETSLPLLKGRGYFRIDNSPMLGCQRFIADDGRASKRAFRPQPATSSLGKDIAFKWVAQCSPENCLMAFPNG